MNIKSEKFWNFAAIIILVVLFLAKYLEFYELVLMFIWMEASKIYAAIKKKDDY